jgi:histidyl-tRNA synthetase
MTLRFQAPRGTQDILPDMQPYWQAVNGAVAEVTRLFGYRRIDTPVFEQAALFEKGSGETTDVVEKEMYTFIDRGEEHLALTPEATPAICRAYLEHGMGSWPQPVRLYTTHPMFRYDRPQKGRYRQHTQFDVEVLGSSSPLVDAEVIEVLWRVYERMGIHGVEVRLGSIDDPDPRRDYVQRLQDYYRPHLDRMSEDAKRRFDRNPLRLLDSKDERDEQFKAGAPKLLDQLSDGAAAHQATVQGALDAAGIRYTMDPLLVRGLDYYNRTVFEIVPISDERAQSTIGGGGRYDGLMDLLGGPPTPGMGFGSGFERIILEMERAGWSPHETTRAQVYIVHKGEGSDRAAVRLGGQLRNAELATVVGEGERSFKAQMRAANSSGALFALILGENELAAGTVVVKDLAADSGQVEVALDEATAHVLRALRASSSG